MKDVIWVPEDRYLKIKIREAKTATVGEVQELHCQFQPSLLDPVGALKRLIASTGATEDNDLFSYPYGDKHVTLHKSRGLKLSDYAWKDKPRGKLTGH